jgi:tRNA1Val (adenine37-N6)-methyltransferase
MPNNFFEFKQFIIYQDQCAMKVCTDSCLLGAYAANKLQQQPMINILDIGAGTGLLSLMLAQKTQCRIDAVEIDDAAYKQAVQNANASPYKNAITIYNSDVKDFTPAQHYDVMISNPPFFENDLMADDVEKNTAKHSTTLTLQTLLQYAAAWLTTNGIFAVLIPYHRTIYFENLATQNGLHLSQKLLVKQTPAHDYFRTILLLSKKTATASTEYITIKETDGNYSKTFADLLKDYYLHL